MSPHLFAHFYSDPHFGHANIIAHAQRPFADVDEMDRELERRYRAAVDPSDWVLWVGDVSFLGNERTESLLSRLPGRKVLVRGNHDGTTSRCLRLGFLAVVEQISLLIAGRKVTVCHYPPWSGPGPAIHPERRPYKPGPGEFIMHGHTHEKERRIGRRIHVGVDAWEFRPASLQEVTALLADLEAAEK